jgi:hypothetical protein
MIDALVGCATKFSRVGRLPNPTSSGRWNNVNNLVDLESDWFTPPPPLSALHPTQVERADHIDLCQHSFVLSAVHHCESVIGHCLVVANYSYAF